MLLPCEALVRVDLLRVLVFDLIDGELEDAGLRAEEHGFRGEGAAVHARFVDLEATSSDARRWQG